MGKDLTSGSSSSIHASIHSGRQPVATEPVASPQGAFDFASRDARLADFHRVWTKPPEGRQQPSGPSGTKTPLPAASTAQDAPRAARVAKKAGPVPLMSHHAEERAVSVPGHTFDRHENAWRLASHRMWQHAASGPYRPFGSAYDDVLNDGPRRVSWMGIGPWR